MKIKIGLKNIKELIRHNRAELPNSTNGFPYHKFAEILDYAIKTKSSCKRQTLSANHLLAQICFGGYLVNVSNNNILAPF